MSEIRKTRSTHSKITLVQAEQIVQRLEAGDTVDAIAKDTGIKTRLILRIMRNETFLRVPRSVHFGERRIKPRKPLAQEVVQAMWNSYFIGGKSCSEIAQDTGIADHRVRHIMNGKSHKAMTSGWERTFPMGARKSRREAQGVPKHTQRDCAQCGASFLDAGRIPRQTCSKPCASAKRVATRAASRAS